MPTYDRQPESDEWYTPPSVFEALNFEFDTDVASPGADVVPWIPAKTHITKDSLVGKWEGTVWMNPPFGKRNGIIPWAKAFLNHSDGIALVPNRTGAGWFKDFASECHGMFLWSPKIKFIRPDGTVGKSPGFGSILLSRGDKGTTALEEIDRQHGFFVKQF